MMLYLWIGWLVFFAVGSLYREWRLERRVRWLEDRVENLEFHT